MLPALVWRYLRTIDPRLLIKLGWNLGFQGMRAVRRFERGLAQGRTIPAFVIISITDACNLRCQGCWVTRCRPGRQLAAADLDRMIVAFKRQGSRFFGLLGGEPLLHPDLHEVLARHPDCYFQIFTNGTLIDDALAARWRRLGNVTPLISLEGLESESDARRGGHEVYRRTLAGLDACVRHRLFTGVATSVCRSNFAELVTDQHLQALTRRGVHYVWYYIYRPVGPHPRPDLALDHQAILALRSFLVEARCRHPLSIVDAYWDHQGRALCPAAMGISHHVGPGGDLEPCPPIQFACEQAGSGSDLPQAFARSRFLAGLRQHMRQTSRGCILLDDPAGLHRFLTTAGAQDSTGRGTGWQELAAMQPRASHHQPGQEIPERHWAYRWAKRNWFFGFGAYG